MNMNAVAAATGGGGSAAADQQIMRPPIPPIVILRNKSAAANSNGGEAGMGTAGGGGGECQGILTIVKKAAVGQGHPAAMISAAKDERQESADLSPEEDGRGAAGTSDDAEFKSGRIRKRRYSMARIQPTRIKKVMQSDEDIGRMVASVPVAIGSAMELFADRLLQASAEALQNSSTKTLSPMHVKQAMSSTPHFAFLEPLLRDVQAGQKAGAAHQQPGSSSYG